MGANSKIEWTDRGAWGNRILTKQGYVIVRCPQYPASGSNGYALEHRLVMASSLQRPLLADEHVHHRNAIRSDNRLENLEPTTNSEHRKHHNSLLTPEVLIGRADHLVALAKQRIKPRTITHCACGCGQTFTTPDDRGRVHKFIHGHNQRSYRKAAA